MHSFSCHFLALNNVRAFLSIDVSLSLFLCFSCLFLSQSRPTKELGGRAGERTAGRTHNKCKPTTTKHDDDGGDNNNTTRKLPLCLEVAQKTNDWAARSLSTFYSRKERSNARVSISFVSFRFVSSLIRSCSALPSQISFFLGHCSPVVVVVVAAVCCLL